MKRWWIGVTLLAVCSLPGMAWSQATTIPSPVGPARIPEPCPDYVAPPLVPGPLRPEIAPAGPGEQLSLPLNHTSAFQEETFPLEQAWWFNIGSQALTRTGWGSYPLFYTSPVSGPLDSGIVPTRLTPQRVVADANQIDLPLMWGVRGSIGYIYDGHYALELAGYTMFQQTNGYNLENPGRLNSYFFNIPLGFEGNNGLWRQADRIQLERTFRLSNAEVNYRYTSGGVTEPELIMGIRYMDMYDRFGIATGDDDIAFLNPSGYADPRRQATLTYTARNRIIAPQLGFEWVPVNAQIAMFGFNAKGAWGANFTELDGHLSRGDGFTGFDGSKSKVIFSQIYEINAFLDLCVLERMRVRAGYQAMWILNVADSQDQISFDLRDTYGKGSYNGTQFWHGPTMEMQFLF